MVRIEVQMYIEINYWIISQWVRFQLFLDVFINGWDVFVRNYIIFDVVDEFVIFWVRVWFQWVYVDNNMIILIVIIRLFCVFIFDVGNFCVNCFVVSNLRFIYVSFNVEFMFYMVNDDIQVKFIYISDDGLVRFFISLYVE